MSHEIFMPALSSTMTEGKIVEWLKNPGDKVERGESVLVVDSRSKLRGIKLSFFMTAQNFMNVVRFKLKSDCVDKYFEVIDKTSFEGMTQRYIAKTGDYDYCFVGIWKSAEAISAQRPAMIAHLDEVRGFMEELSPELGVTDPVSGNIVSKVGYHD